MHLRPTPLPGAYVVELRPIEDERGFFARTFCAEDFAASGLVPTVAQCNLSHSRRKGTLRGLHWQDPPHAEAKLVRCVRGAFFDVFVDLRPGPTFAQWHGVELSAANRLAVYVPPGFAHGVLSLTDDVEMAYQLSAAYAPGHARAVRWDDPDIGIDWPLRPTVISPRDAAAPLLADLELG
jgi:dTDP-4-dehydrorhamnose 3,5-epimerase